MLIKPPVLSMAVPNLSWRLRAYFHVPGFQFVYRKIKHKSSLSTPTPLTQSCHLREEEPLFLYSWVLNGPCILGSWNELLFKKKFHKVVLYKHDTVLSKDYCCQNQSLQRNTHTHAHKYHDFPWCYRKTQNKCQTRKLTGGLFCFSYFLFSGKDSFITK